MFFSLVVGIVLGAVAVVFALQNTDIVTVSFLTWHIEGSLALILILAIATGALVAMLIVLPSFIKDIFILRAMRKQKMQSEEELLALKQTIATPPNISTVETPLV